MPPGGLATKRDLRSCSPLVPLPSLPKLALRQLEDLSPRDAEGFLRLRRLRLRAKKGDAAETPAFVIDHVERAALDAVVVAAHFDRAGARWVYLRSALRPAVALRPHAVRPFEEAQTLGMLWELVAGLVEPDECSPEGLRQCAARELHEELGFQLDPAVFEPLGPATFPAPGIIGERHHYFRVEVDPAERGAPIEDGSVLERGAEIVALPLEEALELVRGGALEDAKTELALRRLAES
jgi:ADP-ribose pyrophosphatase